MRSWLYLEHWMSCDVGFQYKIDYFNKTLVNISRRDAEVTERIVAVKTSDKCIQYIRWGYFTRFESNTWVVKSSARSEKDLADQIIEFYLINMGAVPINNKNKNKKRGKK